MFSRYYSAITAITALAAGMGFPIFSNSRVSVIAPIFIHVPTLYVPVKLSNKILVSSHKKPSFHD